MYCTCGKTQGYANLADDLWVCNNCRRPTHTVFRKLTNMRAPYGATALLSVRGERDGRTIIRWAMEDGTKKSTLEFHPYPRKVDMNAGESLLLKQWELLDSKVDIIMGNPDATAHLITNGDVEEATEAAKHQARGIAECLALIMVPFITTPDEVVKCAVKRYKARNGGEPFETPGLSEHIWDPTRNWDGSPRIEFSAPGTSGTTKKLGTRKPPAKVLDDSDKATIKQALQMQIPAEDLAKTFGVSVEQITGLQS